MAHPPHLEPNRIIFADPKNVECCPKKFVRTGNMFRVGTETETLLHESHQRRKPKTMEPKNEDEAEKNGFRNKRRFF